MGKNGWKKTDKEELKTMYDNRGKYDNASDKKGYIDQSDLTMFIPDEGENVVRILPLHPDETDTKRYGLDVYFHRNVGIDESYYLCLKRMKKGNCPICEHQKNLWNDEPEMAKELYPDQRCLVWIMDRKDDDKVKLWSCPKSMMDDIVGASYRKKTGEILDVSDPDEGFNIYFDRVGKGRNTKYKNIQLDDETNTISNDLIGEISPFRNILIWPTYEEVKGVFTGAVTNGTTDNVINDKEETEKVRNLDEEVEPELETVTETKAEKVPSCFGRFDSEADTCEDCEKRKDCRTDTKNKKAVLQKIEIETTKGKSVKEKLDEALKKRKANNGQT